jgi:hypothetical protein
MPTFETRLAALAALGVLLAGCDPTATAGGSPSRARVTVAGQAVTIQAPPGFCIDAPSTRVDAAGAFVLMGDCAPPGTAPGRPGGEALTAAVSSGGLTGEGDAGGGELEDILEFIDTPEGRALVGRSGRPDRIRIAATQMRQGVLYVLVEDSGPQPIAGFDRQFWRAFLEVRGRMTVLSELGFAGPTGAQEGLNQLASLAASIKAANGG